MYLVIVYLLDFFYICIVFIFFFFKQKAAYEMRISDWSSDVCSSDLAGIRRRVDDRAAAIPDHVRNGIFATQHHTAHIDVHHQVPNFNRCVDGSAVGLVHFERCCGGIVEQDVDFAEARSEEHTSELQSLMRISYAVFCLNKKKTTA